MAPDWIGKVPQNMICDLSTVYQANADERRDPQSGELSEIAREKAEIDTIADMCRDLGYEPPIPGAWSADDDVQEWLRENSKAYTAYCLKQVGVVNVGGLWMEAAGTLRHMRVI